MRRFTLPRNWDFTADTPTNARKDFNHQLSRRLVDSFDEIAFEQLTIANMTRSAAGTLASPGTNVVAKSGLNRSIPGAGWGQLTEFTTYCPNLPAAAGRTRLLQVPVAGGQGGGRTHLADLCPVWLQDAASRVTWDHCCCTACGHTGHATRTQPRWPCSQRGTLDHRAGPHATAAEEPQARLAPRR